MPTVTLVRQNRVHGEQEPVMDMDLPIPPFVGLKIDLPNHRWFTVEEVRLAQNRIECVEFFTRCDMGMD